MCVSDRVGYALINVATPVYVCVDFVVVVCVYCMCMYVLLLCVCIVLNC